ncbi:MAG: hypothetical protein DRN27_02870 [Thermoplasmata archaeon]|nr:MAG: hypothetical protein DRN27_02870 [Thermoplasmata archaeon]
MGIKKKQILSYLLFMCLLTILIIDQNPEIYPSKKFVISVHADPNCANNSSSWHNSSYLNVSVVSDIPRILWYDFQKCTSYTDATSPPDIDAETWSSRRNCMTEVDNETWYRFIINISSDQGWGNITYINISGWHDNGSDSDVNGNLTATGGYNRSGNMGANRNFYMYYENISGTAYFNLTYPSNGTEITIGGFTENNVTADGGANTETHNLSFVFKPGFQFRYAPGPGESATWTNDSVNHQSTNGTSWGPGYNPGSKCWESFNNLWSWNFNITVHNNITGDDAPYRSWINDEFGVYSYTEILSPISDISLTGTPGSTISTANDGANVTIETVSNGNYSLTVNLSDLPHEGAPGVPDTLDNKYVSIRGGNRTNKLNFSNSGRDYIFLYGYGNGDGSVTDWQTHEVNGTYKTTGQSDATPLFPNGYTSSNYNSLNPGSYNVEFTCYIEPGQLSGKYSTHVYYHLQTQTN